MKEIVGIFFNGLRNNFHGMLDLVLILIKKKIQIIVVIIHFLFCQISNLNIYCFHSISLVIDLAAVILKMASEKSEIWLEIKKAAPEINKAGGNAIELLIWSHGKHLWEVQRRIQFVLETAGLSEDELRKREDAEGEP